MKAGDKMRNSKWKPISSGEYPDDCEEVQVTYLGYNDHLPRCNGFAYREEGKWYWSFDESVVNVEITAWRYNCRPYTGEGGAL